jgi:hypothetical protein
MVGGLERERCLGAIRGVEDMEMIEGATECHHTTELPDPDWEIVPLKVLSPLCVTLFFVMGGADSREGREGVRAGCGGEGGRGVGEKEDSLLGDRWKVFWSDDS